MVAYTRRAALRNGGVALAAAVAGCTSVVGDGQRAEEGIHLTTLDVGGSPGGPIRVRPPGAVTLLDFWATWCAPCRPQMDELRAVRREFPDVHMLSITNESDERAIEEFWREYEGTWAVASDPELTTNDRFGVTRIPTLLVFDRDGGEVWRHVGLAGVETVSDALREAGA